MLSLRDLLEAYCANNLNLRPSSEKQLCYSVSSLCRWLDCEPRIDDLSAQQICGWLKSRPPKVTARRDRGNILCLLRYAHAEGLLDSVPRVPRITLDRKAPQAWSVGDLEKLLAAAGNMPGMMRDLPLSKAWWWQSQILYQYETGLRATSALSTRSCDVWLDRRCALVRSDFDKTHADRVVRLSESLCDLLRRGAIGSRDLVWLWPWTKRKLWLDWSELLRSAGLPTGRQSGFHRLRRTHATMAVLSAGWERAQLSLGHSSVAMTKRYVDPTMLAAATPRIELPEPRIA